MLWSAHQNHPGPEVIKLFSCSAQLRLKFILLINVKMPTIVGILTFIRRINYRLGDSTLKFQSIWAILAFMRNSNFMLSYVEHEKSFKTLAPDCEAILWSTHKIYIKKKAKLSLNYHQIFFTSSLLLSSYS